MLLKQFELFEVLAIIPHLALVYRKVPVPKQGHFFFQRTVGAQHAIRPPIGHTMGFQHASAQPVKKLVDHRLQAPVARGLDLETQRLTVFAGQVGGGRTARWKRLQTGIVHPGVIKGG